MVRAVGRWSLIAETAIARRKVLRLRRRFGAGISVATAKILYSNPHAFTTSSASGNIADTAHMNSTASRAVISGTGFAAISADMHLSGLQHASFGPQPELPGRIGIEHREPAAER